MYSISIRWLSGTASQLWPTEVSNGAYWKRPLGRPSHTWLHAVEADLGQQNIGLASAWRKAAISDDWRHIVDTAMLQQNTP